MKRKHVAALMALCMLATTFGSGVVVTQAAEDTVIAEDAVIDAEIGEPDQEADDSYEEAAVQASALEADGLEITDITPVEGYSGEMDGIEASEYEDGYMQVAEDCPIEFKYDGTTLYFRLQKGATPSELPTEKTRVYMYKWASDEYQELAKNITKIVIGEGITALGNHNFESGFNGCFEKVSEVVLPGSVTKIGDYVFQNNTALTTINLSNVTSIGDTALKGTGIKNISFSGDVILGANAFESCTNLESVTAHKMTLAEKAFRLCSNLSNINVDCKFESIPASAFTSTKLSAFDFSEVKTIGTRAFANTLLEKVSFGQADLMIDSRAFLNCKGLSAICYPGTRDKWNTISSSAGIASTVNVHCKDEPVPKHATCEVEGDNILVCEVCGEEYTDGTKQPALGHSYAEEVTVDREATCTEAGEQSRHCTHEGCESRTDVTGIPAIGHAYGDYTVDVAATCTAAGSQSKHCTRCGEADLDSVQEIPALGHDYVSKVTKVATCTEDGVQTDTCTRCGDVKTQAIKATGHQWSDWTKTADATVSGAEQQQRTCATCGAVETKTVGEKLAPTATVNTSTVTLKVKQSTKGLKVTGLAKGDSVAAWKSTDTKVFTVKGNADGTCTLKGLKKGNAKLEITLASGLTKTVAVKVQTAAVKTNKITVAEKKLTVKKGEKASLKATVAPFTSAQKLTYTSSNKKIATVSKNGVVTAKQAGTAKITVKSGSKKVTVVITVPKTKTTSITVAKTITVKKGKTYSLKAKVAPKNSDEKIIYTSSDKKVATVTKTGKVKGVKKGTATITVKSGSKVEKVTVTVR